MHYLLYWYIETAPTFLPKKYTNFFVNNTLTAIFLVVINSLNQMQLTPKQGVDSIRSNEV